MANHERGSATSQGFGSGDLLSSDDRIRGILARFGQLLHRAINGADTFFSASTGEKLSTAVPMLDDEITVWNQHFGILNTIKTKAANGSLYVAGTSSGQTIDGRQIGDEQLRERGFRRVNLDEWMWAPVTSFNPADMQFVIHPLAHFAGQVVDAGERGLHGASLSLRISAQDRRGRWVVSQAEDDNTPMGTVEIAYAAMTFNRTIQSGTANSLSIFMSEPNLLGASCRLHTLETIDQLPIPNDDRIRLFFGQLDRFIRPDALGSGAMSLARY